MPFFQWFDFLGTGIQAFFSWATFNRDAFKFNVTWRQAQKYQQKNYQIGWTAVARGDIRDIMSVSVTRINNYMIVGTLILGIATSFVFNVSFASGWPDFVVYAFFASIVTSIIYLAVSIMFAVKGQNCAFTQTMKLLTYQMRPENPADYTHDYMKQAQWIEMNGIRSLLRIPGIMPNYDTGARASLPGRAGDSRFPPVRSHGEPSTGLASRQGVGFQQNENRCTDDTLEDLTPLESLVRSSMQLWYLTKFGRFMRLWLPYDTYSKYSMGLGIVSLGHAMGYFCLGKLISEGRHLSAWPACTLMSGFSYTILLAVAVNFQNTVRDIGVRLVVFLFLAGGPIAGIAGSVAESEIMHAIMVSCCYFLHFVFWAVWLFLARKGIPNDKRLSFESLTGNYWADQPYSVGPGDLWVDGSLHRLSRTSRSASKADVGLAVRSCGSGEGVDTRGRSEGGGSRCSDQALGPFLGRSGEGGPQALGETTAETGIGLSEEKWPTDDKRFEDKAFRTSEKTRKILLQAIFVTAMLWFSMFVWSFSGFWYIGLDGEVRPAAGVSWAQVNEIVLDWPSPFFRPHTIACAGNRAFLADRFRIYEFSVDGGQMVRVPCAVRSIIVSVGASCDQTGRCGPLVLVRGGPVNNGSTAPMQVVDCEASDASPLLRESRPAEHLSVIALESSEAGATTDGRRHELLVVHGGEVVQYARAAPPRNAWEPQWHIGSLGGSDLCALGAADKLLLSFFRRRRAGMELSPAAVEIVARDVRSMERRGLWALPRRTKSSLPALASGCALAGGSKALVLLEAGEPGDPPPRVAKLSLTD